jgi:hypothetical protein
MFRFLERSVKNGQEVFVLDKCVIGLTELGSMQDSSGGRSELK